MSLIQTQGIPWKERKTPAVGNMTSLEKHQNQRSRRRSMDQQLHEATWNLCGAFPRLAGKLLFPQRTCNDLGRNGQRRISQWNHPGFLNRKEGSASSLPTDIQSVLVTTSARAITIPVTLYKMENRKIAETTALINSGATICCINLHLAWRVKWPLEKLCWPMYAQNADGTNNSGGMIWHQVKLYLRIDGRNTI